LLHPTPIEELTEEMDEEEWRKVERYVGYHGKGAITQFVDYNLRKTCRKQ
jgi:hypothetical protein